MKNKTVTPEQVRQTRLSNIYMGFEFCPTPTYFFNIGDSVNVGSLDNVQITDVLEDGKLYEIEYDNVDRYNKLISRDYGFWY